MDGWPPPGWFQQPAPANDGWGPEPPAWLDPTSQPTGMAEDTAGLLGLVQPQQPSPEPPAWVQSPPIPGPEAYPWTPGVAPELPGAPPKPMGYGAIPEAPKPTLPQPPEPAGEKPPQTQGGLVATRKPPPISEDLPYVERQRQSAEYQAGLAEQQGDALAGAAKMEADERRLAATNAHLEQAQAHDQYQRDVQRTQAERAKLHAEAESLAKAKMDPGRFWSDAAAPAKIGMAITAIVGGWIGAKNGGRNQGLELIQNIIDRDMQAQAADMANRRDMLGMKQSLLGDMAQQSGDIYRAATVKTTASYNWAADAAKALGDSARSDAERMKYYGLADELRMQGADKADAYFAAQEAAKAQAQQQAFENKMTQSRVAQGWSGLKLERDKMNAGIAEHATDRFIEQARWDAKFAQDAKAAGHDPTLVIGGVDDGSGRGYVIGLDKDRVAKASAIVDVEKKKLAILFRMRELATEGGGDKGLGEKLLGLPKAPAQAEMDKLMTDWAKLDNVSKGGGALSTDEAKDYADKVFGGGRTWLSNPAFDGNLIANIRTSEDSLSTTLQGATAKPGHYIYDHKTQRLVPVPPGFEDGQRFVVTNQQRQDAQDDIKRKAARNMNPGLGQIIGN
jgi:hypothetical protein